jgi:hypothetical protein
VEATLSGDASMETKCDALAALSSGRPPSSQKNLQRTQSLSGCGGVVSQPRAERCAAMTSLRRALGAISMSALGHSRPSHFVPVLNNVRYASDSDHSRYESELTLWATFGPSASRQNRSYSITSSARMSSVEGILRPRVFAVLRLMTSSMSVGNSTGRSPGFAPFKILST